MFACIYYKHATLGFCDFNLLSQSLEERSPSQLRVQRYELFLFYQTFFIFFVNFFLTTLCINSIFPKLFSRKFLFLPAFLPLFPPFCSFLIGFWLHFAQNACISLYTSEINTFWGILGRKILFFYSGFIAYNR